MAMPSGNMVVSDKMQHQNGGWIPDERDGFILWLKSEFAAANAIIDSLCGHLRAVGEAGEYDAVIGSVQQRRCNWNSVLHMQQYFSVAEVLNSLQQVTWRRQQRRFDPLKTGGGKEYRRSGSGVRHSSGFEYRGNGVSSKHDNVDDKVKTAADGKKEAVTKSHANDRARSPSCLEGATRPDYELEEKDAHSIQNLSKKQDFAPTPKTFVRTEILEGKTVNVVEGLKLYEDLFEETKVSKLVSLAYDLRTAGRKGQFQGQVYVASKRPMNGHGREMMQLGLQIAYSPPEDENGTVTSKDPKIEPIPPLLQDVIDRLFSKEILTVKPDSCIIDFYNEGDHSQPHVWPSWFGRPVGVLLLTECDMAFGRAIGSDYPGEYRGALKLSLAPGSFLAMQGNSTDLARHAIPSVRKQRILVTFTKSQPKKFTPADRIPSPSSHWAPPPARPPNHILRHPAGPKHLAAQTPPTNGVLAPRPPVPGTGVFLPPPGPGNSPPQQAAGNAADTSDGDQKQEGCNGGVGDETEPSKKA